MSHGSKRHGSSRWQEGLIVLSGCGESELARLAAHKPQGWREAATRLAEEYAAVFGDRFYVELQHHDIFGDSERVAALAEVAAATNIHVVATNNAHYHVRSRHRLNDVLVAVRHRRTLDSSHDVRRPNSEFFLKSEAEMRERFRRYPEAVDNTVIIAERCSFDLTTDLPYRLPDHQAVPEGASMDSYLRGICERAFERKYTPVRARHPRRRSQPAGAGTRADRKAQARRLLPRLLGDPDAGRRNRP